MARPTVNASIAMRTAATGILPCPFCGRDPQHHGGQRAAGHHRQRQLEVSVKNVRRDDGHEHAAQRPAERDHHIETGEMPRIGLQARQFAVAHHAADEQRGDERGDGPGDVRIAFVGVNRIRRAVQRDHQ